MLLTRLGDGRRISATGGDFREKMLDVPANGTCAGLPPNRSICSCSEPILAFGSQCKADSLHSLALGHRTMAHRDGGQEIMSRTHRILTTLCVVAAAGCASPSPDPPPTVPPPPPCPVNASGSWRATVGPGNAAGGQSLLTLTGEIAFPYSGWQPSWSEVQVLLTAPPTAIVNFDARYAERLPTAISQQVRHSWPAPETVASIRILCRGRLLAELPVAQGSGGPQRRVGEANRP